MSRLRRGVEAEFAKAGVVVGGANPWDPQVRDDRFFTRVALDSLMGLGESYMDGWWDCASVDGLFTRLAEVGSQTRRRNLRNHLAHVKNKIFNMQSMARSKKVCETHYDLGNDLFEKMLDSRMVYTCAYWRDAQTLEAAQLAKLDLICIKLGLKPGMKVLDIGCGFGSFMKHAVEKYGVSCVGYSLSARQTELGRKRCAGLDIEFVERDYREISGKFDRVVSIGMVEAVGLKNYGTFMQTVARSLRPNGLALIHTMGGNVSTTYTERWFDQYIFPNGLIPSIAQLGAAMEGRLVMEDWHAFGPDYDKTLLAWNDNFQRAWPSLSGSYTPRFKRMWEFYLLSLAGAFRSRHLQLWQILLSKGSGAPPIGTRW